MLRSRSSAIWLYVARTYYHVQYTPKLIRQGQSGCVHKANGFMCSHTTAFAMSSFNAGYTTTGALYIHTIVTSDACCVLFVREYCTLPAA
eukprot:6082-Heterococcus_DN1.PRE.1